MDVNVITRNYLIASASATQRSGKGDTSTASNVSQTTGDDVVSISPQGSAMCGLAGKLGIDSLLGFTPETPGRVSVDELEYYGRKFLDEYSTRLNTLFGENGIDIDTPVELAGGSDGSIVVTNNHPDKAAIEKLFKDNPELGNEFKKIDNMLTLAEAGRETVKFQEAYAQCPEAAVMQYGYLFTTQLQGTLQFSNEGANILFHRVPQAGT